MILLNKCQSYIVTKDVNPHMYWNNVFFMYMYVYYSLSSPLFLLFFFLAHYLLLYYMMNICRLHYVMLMIIYWDYTININIY